MQRLSLIRIGTYALLLVAIFTAYRVGYVIPLAIPLHGFPVEEPYYYGGFSPASRAGFANTDLSGRTVLRLSEEALQRERIPTSMLDQEHPFIELQSSGVRLQWTVRWLVKPTREKNTTLPNAVWIKVTIDDQTREAIVERLDRNLRKSP